MMHVELDLTAGEVTVLREAVATATMLATPGLNFQARTDKAMRRYVDAANLEVKVTEAASHG